MGDDVLQAAFVLGGLDGVEDAMDVSSDLRTHASFEHVCHGVADRMELAPLPRHPSQDGLTGSPEPSVIVTDDELHAVYVAFLKTFEDLPTVWLGLGELHAAAEHTPLAVGVDPGRRE